MGDLEVEKHVNYILSVEKKEDDFESVVMEHLRINGAYWGLTSLDLLGKIDAVDAEEVVAWVMKCQHESGGFGGNIGHDPHLLYTLSAIQVLSLFDKINMLDIDQGCRMKMDLSQVTCGVKLIQGMWMVDLDAHLVANLMLGKDLLGWWLCERQVKAGGLNGRPGKLPDVCYSWWVLSSLIMIDREHWIGKEKLVKYILDCQDKERGGISDRPDDAVDVFHTYFGVAGLSLLEYPGLKVIDPAYALPVDVVNRIFFRR